jgi:hypothetical protein
MSENRLSLPGETPRPPSPPRSQGNPGVSISGKAMKVVVPLDPHELARLTAAEGQARTLLRIGLPDRSPLAADIATKALRKAIATIRDNGPDNCVSFIQGKLAGTKVTEAGLVAQVKIPKPAQVESDRGGQEV